MGTSHQASGTPRLLQEPPRVPRADPQLGHVGRRVHRAIPPLDPTPSRELHRAPGHRVPEAVLPRAPLEAEELLLPGAVVAVGRVDPGLEHALEGQRRRGGEGQRQGVALGNWNEREKARVIAVLNY